MSAGPPPTQRGVPFDLAVSGLIKAIRRGQEEQALALAVELDESGYTAHVWKRLLIATSEDVGLAEPHLPATIHALHQTAQHLMQRRDDRQRPWRLMLIHAVLLLVRAKKSRIVDHALIAFYEGQPELPPIPDVAHDKHTKSGRQRGRSWDHFFEDGTLLADPDSGELSEAPSVPDPYRERARDAVERRGDRSKAAATRAQLALDEDDR